MIELICPLLNKINIMKNYIIGGEHIYPCVRWPGHLCCCIEVILDTDETGKPQNFLVLVFYIFISRNKDQGNPKTFYFFVFVLIAVLYFSLHLSHKFMWEDIPNANDIFKIKIELFMEIRTLRTTTNKKLQVDYHQFYYIMRTDSTM